MRIVTVLLFLAWSLVLNSQTRNDAYQRVDRKIAEHSSSFDQNAVSELVKFIKENFSTKTEKLRASFVWIANNFDYDVENMFATREYFDSQELIDALLENRKGVCAHFAYLFSEIGNQLGIKTVVISGYTKQRGVVDTLSHAWNASLIDSVWYLFDPTWGTGYVNDNKFTRRLNNDYFKVNPSISIQSHMPFDPLWQFLNHTISSEEFYAGRTEINKEKPFFNFVDSLKVHENLSRVEQLEAANRRIEQNGITNTLISNQLRQNTRQIEQLKTNNAIDIYNIAVAFYNDGINEFNKFINYRNRQFTPRKTENEIRGMITSTERLFTNSRNELRNIYTSDLIVRNSVNQLNSMLNEAINELKNQNNFVDRYFNTWRIFRGFLFLRFG
jgi:transglutaminase/protease-like cytokinesis protein 3